jgi:hypothetical protein
MYRRINETDFIDAFRAYGRDNQFSYDGLCALFNYLEDFEKDTGEEIEPDVIELCCNFSEYNSALDCIVDMGYNDFDPQLNDDVLDKEYEIEEEALEYLRYNTTVIECPNSIIIQEF